MSIQSNLILITNKDSVLDILKPKLVLLREIDNIISAKYSDAIDVVKKVAPDMVLIYCSSEKEECLDLIRKIKTDKSTENTSVLLVLDEYNQDFILNAYDENISDFFTMGSDDAEILIRTLWCLKKYTLAATISKQQILLEKLGVIDKTTGFFAEKDSAKIFETEFEVLKKTSTEAILMLVSASEESKTTLSVNTLSHGIKKSTRNSDVIVHAPSNRFFLLLPETNLRGAFRVWDKIKNNIGTEHNIVAGVSEIEGKDFADLKKELLNAIIEANSTEQNLVIVNENIQDCSNEDWLGKMSCKQKNFKLFKQAFTKKLDKVITPVFFQIQKLYEDKLFDTKIEQFSNETLSSFSLKNPKQSSELKITYPGFSKINVDIIHQGLDSPENKRFNLDLTELDEKKLTQILEGFIKEFKGSIN